ncbi:hypothetical protein SISSUDRAFT_813070 [Sistotremastrum suecicum HHB10207 ss-3]|uniref:Uncharacterized protein n=1 Tax=Sistotremastrum suecicum HHB10207 ss-3 TaxID=1314776 RepID=A0A166CWE2_9AGAM|nr:hypothetical protein SISSUDRAFT_813070 [Sistotremastrum suecicum HHB10207 ss-3]
MRLFLATVTLILGALTAGNGVLATPTPLFINDGGVDPCPRGVICKGEEAAKRQVSPCPKHVVCVAPNIVDPCPKGLICSVNAVRQVDPCPRGVVCSVNDLRLRQVDPCPEGVVCSANRISE